MREIKFRGKTLNNKWVYGGAYCLNGRAYIITSVEPSINAVEVKPETIGMYITKDFKDKDMYEGDIIKWRNTGACEVADLSDEDIRPIYGDDWIVIGNIHNNN